MLFKSVSTNINEKFLNLLQYTMLHLLLLFTIKQMHENVDCSYFTCRAFVRNQMQISFIKLGHEECEQCRVFKQHDNTQNKNKLDLDKYGICKKWNAHIQNATNARKKYREDTDRMETNGIILADQYKVVMLSHINTFKQLSFKKQSKFLIVSVCLLFSSSFSLLISYFCSGSVLNSPK